MKIVKLFVMRGEVRLLLCKLALGVLVEFVDEGVHILVEVVLNLLLRSVDDGFSVLLPFAEKAVYGLLKRRGECFCGSTVLRVGHCLVCSLQVLLSCW